MIARAPPPAPTPITIEMVEDQLAVVRFRALRFAPNLEVAYAADVARERAQQAARRGLAGIALVALFLVQDWLLTPDVFGAALFARLAIVTSIGLLATVLIAKHPGTAVREGSFAILDVVITAVGMALFLASTSPCRVMSPYTILLSWVFGIAVQRRPFAHALVSSIGSLAVVVAAMRLSGAYDARALEANTMFFLGGMILLMAAGYALERDARRGYLLAWRTRLLKERLEPNALVDPLTGLWNRRHLAAAVDAAWTAADAAPTPMAFILLDIDRFKAFNDDQGHLAGDVCLRRVAACLRDSVETDDALVARFGGEEFVVFLRDVAPAAAIAIAERLRQAVRLEAIAHPSLGAGSVVTVSLGVAFGLAPSESAALMIAAADAALYRAKDAGRDRASHAALDATGAPFSVEAVAA
jgi:diguanylate cyclase (GGDEF)-like protein